jgi:tetratricopeptide (TPR) repeat protein
VVLGIPHSETKQVATTPETPNQPASPLLPVQRSIPGGATTLPTDASSLDVTPYFPGPGADAMARGDYQTAANEFRNYLGNANDPLVRARLLILVAICDGELGQHQSAANGFIEAAAAMPLLADYLYYQAARSYYDGGDKARAREFAERVTGSSRHADNAAMLVGQVLRSQGDWPAAAAHYQT